MRLRMYATKYDKYDTDDHITEIIRVYLVLSFLSASPGRSLEQIPLLTLHFFTFEHDPSSLLRFPEKENICPPRVLFLNFTTNRPYRAFIVKYARLY